MVRRRRSVSRGGEVRRFYPTRGERERECVCVSGGGVDGRRACVCGALVERGRSRVNEQLKCSMHPAVLVNRICVYPRVQAPDTSRWTGKFITTTVDIGNVSFCDDDDDDVRYRHAPDAIIARKKRKKIFYKYPITLYVYKKNNNIILLLLFRTPTAVVSLQ